MVTTSVEAHGGSRSGARDGAAALERRKEKEGGTHEHRGGEGNSPRLEVATEAGRGGLVVVTRGSATGSPWGRRSGEGELQSRIGGG